MGPAYAVHKENSKGALTPGTLADLVILDRDIFQIDPMDILQVKVVETIIHRRFVWRDLFLE